MRIQSFPQFPTIVSDTFRGRRAMDRSAKSRELQNQLPAEGQKWMSASRLSARIEESTNAMISRYKDLTVLSFLRNVNDANVTWVREVTAAGHEKAVLGPGKPHAIDVYYVSDFSPDNEDGYRRSLGDPACKAAVDQSFPTDRLQNPRTLNHHSMLGAGSTCEGVNTNLLYMGTMGSFFSWHVEDSLLLSVSYLQTGASKYWFFVPRSELPLMVRVLEEHMDPDVLQAAGGDVWTVLAKKAVLWPATFFIAHGIRVGFHAMEVGDYVVTGYGVPHSGFNGGKNVASAVNLACTGWLSYAMEHAAQWHGKLAILIPFEKLLVLAAMKLVDGEWWVGNAKTYEACDPAEFRRDLLVMVAYLDKSLERVLAFMKMDAHRTCVGKTPTVVGLDRAPQLVQQFVADNAVGTKGDPLVIPHEDAAKVTDYSVDGASCPHCGKVAWFSVVVCQTCIEELGDEAAKFAPFCCLECAPDVYDGEHDRLRKTPLPGTQPVDAHVPLVVQRLANGRVSLMVEHLKNMIAVDGEEGRS